VEAIAGAAPATTCRSRGTMRALIATLRTQVELGRALRRSSVWRKENSRLRGNAPQMIARSPAMQAVLRVLEKVAPSRR